MDVNICCLEDWHLYLRQVCEFTLLGLKLSEMNLFSFCHSSCWTRHYVFIWKCLWIDNVEMMVIFSLRHFFLSNKKIPFELIKEIFSITDFSHNFDPLATLLIFVNLFYLTVRWRTTIRQQSLNFREKWGRRGAMFEKKNFCC